VLQCVAMCCNVLQYVAVCCGVSQGVAALKGRAIFFDETRLKRVATHESMSLSRVLQCGAVCCSGEGSCCNCTYLCVAVRCSVLQCVAVCCSVLRCNAVCCNGLQCIEVCCRSVL